MRSKAEEYGKLLQQFFKAAGQQVVVSEHEELTPDHLLLVSFDVLAYPNDQLLINGQSFLPARSPNP